MEACIVSTKLKRTKDMQGQMLESLRRKGQRTEGMLE